MRDVENDNVVFSPRMGGDVLRYHTWPTIRQQTVMHHTGNVIRIYWEVFGSVPSEVCAYLVFHDLPEVRTGDPPHPTKLRNPVLKRAYDDLEDETLVGMVGTARAQRILGDVSEQQRVRMKACDLLEMGEFASVERAMGNRFAGAILVNVRSAIAGLALTEDDRVAVEDFMTGEMARFD